MTIKCVNYSFYPSIKYYNSVLNYFIFVFDLFKQPNLSAKFNKTELKIKY